MQKRNLTILITIILAVAVVVFGFMFFFQRPATDNTNTPRTNFFGQFFPFGRNNQTQNPTDNTVDLSGENPNQNEQTFIPKMAKISSMPVAGFIAYEKERFINLPIVEPTEGEVISNEAPTAPPTEFVPFVKYIAKADANVYQTFLDKIDERRLSTTIIPKIHDAYFSKDGESVIVRYLKSDNQTIETFLGRLPKDVIGGDITDNTNLRGSFLPDNVTDISVSNNKEQFFYLVDGKDFSTGNTIDKTGDKKTLVFDSPFTEWLSNWANKDSIIITTKPASNFAGIAYSLDPNKKELRKVLSGINGLVTLGSPDGKKLLYSDNNLNLFTLNTENNQRQQISIRTLAEKCIWSNDSENIFCSVPQNVSGSSYPELWYQGEVSFSDSFWKINTNTGETLNIANSEEIAGESVDGIKLSLNEKESHLFFINKKDSFLWVIRL